VVLARSSGTGLATEESFQRFNVGFGGDPMLQRASRVLPDNRFTRLCQVAVHGFLAGGDVPSKAESLPRLLLLQPIQAGVDDDRASTELVDLLFKLIQPGRRLLRAILRFRCGRRRPSLASGILPTRCSFAARLLSPDVR
jgi:hypothetical protein